MGFFSSWRKSANLKRISLILGGGGASTANDYFKISKQKEKAENELYEIIERDPRLHEIMLKHGATRDVLRDIYWALLKSGAGQWAGGDWVPASALAFGFTLEFVLSNAKRNEDWKRHNDHCCGYIARLLSERSSRPNTWHCLLTVRPKTLPDARNSSGSFAVFAAPRLC